MKNIIKTLKLENRVKLCDAVENIEEYLNKSKSFIFSSDFEGMPNALTEAQVLGIPCISTNLDGGGAKDIIINDVNGLLVSKGDFEALAYSMKLILTNEEIEIKSSDNVSSVKEKYGRENFLRNGRKLYK